MENNLNLTMMVFIENLCVLGGGMDKPPELLVFSLGLPANQGQHCLAFNPL